MGIMNIEQLNKSQIVLLTLLVSFVTSIATGIVTISLMEQAPPVIPQTINRVVERTIERVVPHETQTATVITTEKTVVVKETDLITQAVARARPSSVRLYYKADDGAGDFVARGVVIAEGYVIAPIPEPKVDNVYLIQSGEKSIEAKVISIDGANNIVLFALSEPEKEHLPAAAVSASAITLGQTLVAMTGESSLKVASGIATAINESTLESGETIQASFEINIANDQLVLGSTLLNTDGAVIGMYVGNVKIVPASFLAALMASISKHVEKEKAANTKDAKKDSIKP